MDRRDVDGAMEGRLVIFSFFRSFVVLNVARRCLYARQYVFVSYMRIEN